MNLLLLVSRYKYYSTMVNVSGLLYKGVGRMRTTHMLILTFILLGLALYKPTQAQDTGSCPSFVQTSLQQLGNYCANSAANSACFGSPQVTTTYADTDSPTSFSKPGDRTDLSRIAGVQTSVLDFKTRKW